MKNTLRYLIIVGLMACPVRVLADYDDEGAGARARAMGNAFTAVADDVYGMYYNPAGLGFLRSPQVGADFGKLFFGLDDDSNLLSGFTAVAYPILKVDTGKGGSGSAFQNLVSTSSAGTSGISTSTLKSTSYRHLGSVGVGLKYFALAEYYTEYAYYLGYGRPMGNKWSWGVNLKYLQENYIIDDYLRLSPVFDYGEKSGVQNVSADVGFMYNLAPRIFVGMSVLDVNEPDLGLKNEDKLPSTSRLGVAWREKELTWACDISYRSRRMYYSVGFEQYIRKILGLRIGLTYGGRNYFNAAGGFSVKLMRIRLDYVFQYPFSGLKDIQGTHRASILFRFGRDREDEVEIGSLEYYYAKSQNELASVTQELVETKREKDNLESILIEESTLRIRERIKAAKTEAARAAAMRKAAQEAKPKEIKHVVQPGDTLQSISKKYLGDEKYWNEIFKINKENIGRGGALKPGQVIVVPNLSHAEITLQKEPAPAMSPVNVSTPEKETAEPAVVPIKVVPIKVETPRPAPKKTAEPPKAQKPSGPKKHVVKSGENLRSIAEKYYGDSSRWKDIYKANKGKVIGGQIAPGQEITIP